MLVSIYSSSPGPHSFSSAAALLAPGGKTLIASLASELKPDGEQLTLQAPAALIGLDLLQVALILAKTPVPVGIMVDDIDSLDVLNDTTLGQLAIDVIAAQTEALEDGIPNAEAANLILRLAGIAAALPVEFAAVYIPEAVALSGLAKRDWNKVLTAARNAAQRNCSVDSGVLIEGPVGTWAPKIAEKIADKCYVSAGSICLLDASGALEPHRGAMLTSWLDDEKQVLLQKLSKDGKEHIGLKMLPAVGTALDGWIRGSGKRDPNLRHTDMTYPVPVLVRTAKGSRIGTGYDRETRVLAGEGEIKLTDNATALSTLREITRDFVWPTAADEAKAFAWCITPALVAGKWITGRPPFFFLEKSRNGAGGGTFAALISSIYSQDAGIINGPGTGEALEESLIAKLSRGYPLITLDNIRGTVLTDCSLLESALTEKSLTGRVKFERLAEIDMSRRIFACISNGAEMSPDMASRAFKLRLLAQMAGYAYSFNGREALCEHVAKNRSRYISAIYSLIHNWEQAGAKLGNTHGFRFPDWAAVAGGIIAHAFGGIEICADIAVDAMNAVDPRFQQMRTMASMAASSTTYTEWSAGQLENLVADKMRLNKATIGTWMTERFGDKGEIGEEKTSIIDCFEIVRVIRRGSSEHPIKPFYRFRAVAPSVKQADLGIPSAPNASIA